MIACLTQTENEQLIIICNKIRNDYSSNNATARKKLIKTIDDFALEAYRAGYIELGNSISKFSNEALQEIIDNVADSDIGLQQLITERDAYYQKTKSLTKEIQKRKLRGVKPIVIR